MGASTQRQADSETDARIGIVTLLIFPGALTFYLAFNSGGLFDVTTAFSAVLVLIAVAVSVVFSGEPLRALGPWGLAGCGLLACYAGWTFVSMNWSHSASRSLIAFDRVLLYLGVLALFACIPRTDARFRLVLRGLLVASAAVAIVSLTSRLLPEFWPTSIGLVDDRLSYPLTYWNTLGLLVGMACILAVHHTSDEHEPRAIRICAAALLPLLAATLLLTFSRGAILVTIVGITIYLVAARPYGFPGAFLAVAPPTAFALYKTYAADLIHEGNPIIPAAVSQGETLALVLLACAVGAAALRAATLKMDGRIAQLFSEAPEWRRRTRILGMTCGMVFIAAFLIGGGPGATSRHFDQFVSNTTEAAPTDEGQTSRLLTIGNDGRLPMWEVARDAYRADPLRGSGAGTFQLRWERHRGENPPRLYAYSVYIETLGELGVIGLLLLGGALLAIIGALAWRLRGPHRSAYAAGLAVALAWALHAGVDIDWQSPAVSVPVFALGGLAMARRREQILERSKPPDPHRTPLTRAVLSGTRPAIALGCVLLALIPAGMALAQAHLRDSIKALGTGDCRAATPAARESINFSDAGPRPYEVLAMCAARRGDNRSAIHWARISATHDPNSWEPHFVTALALGAAGRDPRQESGEARRAKPSLGSPRDTSEIFPPPEPSAWKQSALSAPFAME